MKFQRLKKAYDITQDEYYDLDSFIFKIFEDAEILIQNQPDRFRNYPMGAAMEAFSLNQDLFNKLQFNPDIKSYILDQVSNALQGETYYAIESSLKVSRLKKSEVNPPSMYSNVEIGGKIFMICSDPSFNLSEYDTAWKVGLEDLSGNLYTAYMDKNTGEFFELTKKMF